MAPLAHTVVRLSTDPTVENAPGLADALVTGLVGDRLATGRRSRTGRASH